MDKVIIFGTFHFLGFNLCQDLLEAGIEVCGYRWTEEIIEEFLDEKRFLIGRNANFTEKRLDASEEHPLDGHTIISYYDLYYSNNIDPSELYEQFIPFFNQRNNDLRNGRVFFLLPIISINQVPESLNKHFNNLIQNDVPFQIIYLPTIYGPWQSSNFLFQKFLQANENQTGLHLDEREQTGDAIYIGDVTKEIMKILVRPETSDYVLQSAAKNQWLAGARYFNLEKFLSENLDFHFSSEHQKIKTIAIKGDTTVEEGLNKQRKHYKRLLR